MNTAYTVNEDLPLKMGKKPQAIDMETLYSKEQRPTWAGGTYQSTILESCSFNQHLTNKRSYGRDIEFSLSRELTEESDLDQQLPILIDADTNPQMQVAEVFVD